MGAVLSTRSPGVYQGFTLFGEAVAATDLKGRGQDRFALARRGATLLVGVFDGHSPEGQPGGGDEADKAAAYFERALFRPELWAAVKAADSAALPAALSRQFTLFQEAREADYAKNVREPLLAQKAKLEAEIGEELPLELPQEGGTTATVVILTRKTLAIAWVGDSEAVLARTPAGADADQVAAVALTTRKHHTSCAEEAQRVAAAGAHLHSGVCFVQGVSGGVRVTRSLGDCALHANSILLGTPDVETFERTEGDAFALIASDGLWDCIDHATAVRMVADRVRGCGAAGTRAALAAARQSLFDAAGTAAHPDDTAVVLLCLNAAHPLFAKSTEPQIPAPAPTAGTG